MQTKKRKMFMPQKLMRKVMISLVPIILASIYYFGLRSLFLMIWITLLGVVTEGIFEKQYNKPISEAVIVTCILYTLTLPPNIPFLIAGIGIIFGVIFGKEVFGGFGRNILILLWWPDALSIYHSLNL